MKEFEESNFTFDKNGRKVLLTGRKCCGKRRNCMLRAISHFSTVFSKGLSCGPAKSWACWERVNS